MSVSLGLFALSLSLLGAEGPRDRAAPDITYEVRVVTLKGLEWRREYFAQLQPVTTQSGASVWTTGDETADSLAEKDPAALRVPRVTAGSQAPVHLSRRTSRRVTSGLTRLADGPRDHATKVAYSPSYEEIREGFSLTLSGRKIDQGVLALVVLDETRVGAVHHLDLSETVAGEDCCAQASKCEAEAKAEGKCRVEGALAGKEACAGGKIASQIEIPEIVNHAVAGEWLIPNMGALVVSLGVQTVDGGTGWAVPVERLMLIEATPTRDTSIRQAALPVGAWSPSPGPEPAAKPAAEADAPPPPKGNPLKLPALPGRSLPQALAADGSEVPLPPLPEEPAPPSSLPGSSEPCATPQAKDGKQPTSLATTPGATTVDPASRKASFRFDPTPCNAPPADGPRPFVLRFPVTSGNVTVDVEVRASGLFPGVAKGRPAPPTPSSN